MSDWSEALQDATQERLEDRTGAPILGGKLYLKHKDDAFGYIARDDLSRGVLKVVNRVTKAEETFARAEELILSGWVVD